MLVSGGPILVEPFQIKFFFFSNQPRWVFCHIVVYVSLEMVHYTTVTDFPVPAVWPRGIQCLLTSNSRNWDPRFCFALCRLFVSLAGKVYLW